MAKSARRPSRPQSSGRQSSAAASGGSATGFAFANPQPTSDDFDVFTKNDIQADSDLKASDQLQPIPKPWASPPTLSLDAILGTAPVQQITAANSMTFHCVGDTGGIHEPANQFAVADAMAADLVGKTYQTGRPAFFFHLGDVVYYLGQELLLRTVLRSVSRLRRADPGHPRQPRRHGVSQPEAKDPAGFFGQFLHQKNHT
jgi:hypothetical protein